MMSRKTTKQWFDEYAVCHQNGVNQLIHWVCVPAIAAAVLGLLWAIPFPWIMASGFINWATIVIAASLVFYFRLSITLAIGMTVFCAAVVAAIIFYESNTTIPVWIPSLTLFVVAWIGQFIGHKIEGKKPAFFQDLQFLLIGPAWVLDKLFRKLGH
ncbi:hypothetical protein Poly51_28720 [Rubripirellula tenax]|uniref:DUF962 domain-containing protein n=1 Tax=Rubripirellula tenax TaxID=2528015 RepID=A0A5C6F5G2_9BACT|nr:Mpo1-like protein [Rubripirellula tenax]TWU56953.1 hypothetical protein Poly51_28720 [Rubripirellula tenax]